MVGGYDKTLLANPNTTLKTYPVMNNSWSTQISGLSWNETSVFLLNETAFVHFDILNDYIQFPVATWGKISKSLSTLSGVICNNTNITGCVFKDLCSNLPSAKLPNLKIQTPDSVTYTIPSKLYLVDLPNG